MSAKNGNPGFILKLALVLLLVAGAAVVAFFQLRDTAIVQPVKRGPAVDAVPGSVVVYPEQGLRQLVSEADGKVAWCEPLLNSQHFKKGDVLLKLDTTDLDRQYAQADLDYETGQKRLKILFGDKPEWLEARQKLDEAIERQKAAKGSVDEVAQLQNEFDAVARKLNPQWIAAVEGMEDAERQYARGAWSDKQIKDARDSFKNFDKQLKLADFDAATARHGREVELENRKLQLKKMTVIAPTDGVVDSTTVWQGALIRSGTPVATFFSDDRVVVAKIGEEDFSKVKVGQAAKVRLVIYGDQAPFDAKVARIQPTAEAETQLYKVFLDVAADREKLIANSNGQVNITVGEHLNVLLIPRRAVFDLNGSDGSVWVVKDGRTALRSVKLGYVSLSQVEVEKGLAQDEQVIVENVRDFHDGQYVRAEALK